MLFPSTCDTEDDQSSTGEGQPVFFSGLDDPEDSFAPAQPLLLLDEPPPGPLLACDRAGAAPVASWPGQSGLWHSAAGAEAAADPDQPEGAEAIPVGEQSTRALEPQPPQPALPGHAAPPEPAHPPPAAAAPPAAPPELSPGAPAAAGASPAVGSSSSQGAAAAETMLQPVPSGEPFECAAHSSLCQGAAAPD